MAQIFIVFGDVQSGDVESYIRQRVRLLHHAGSSRIDGQKPMLNEETLNKYVSDIVTSLDKVSVPPIAAPVDLSSLPKRNAEIIRLRTACMIKEINHFFPLIDGEHVKEDVASYLNKDWDRFPSCAVVLKRLTNCAVTYYVYPNIRVDAEKGELTEHDLLQSDRAVLISANYEPNFGAAARTLADGLAGLLPPPLNVLGATLIALYWPSGNDAANQWNHVYEELQKIVRNELARNNVNQACDKMKGFIFFLDTEYKAFKESSSPTKQQLLDKLEPYNTAFFLDIVNVFMHTSTSELGLAAASLANFMIGANLHMALNQERALVDPSVPTPSSSPYAKTVSNLAKDYAAYARNTAPYVKQLRLAQISEVQKDRQSACEAGGCIINYSFFFQDSNNGYRSGDYTYTEPSKNPPPAQENAQRARTDYYNNISSQMDDILNKQVYAVASSWDKLVSNPVPNKS